MQTETVSTERKPTMVISDSPIATGLILTRLAIALNNAGVVRMERGEDHAAFRLLTEALDVIQFLERSSPPGNGAMSDNRFHLTEFSASKRLEDLTNEIRAATPQKGWTSAPLDKVKSGEVGMEPLPAGPLFIHVPDDLLKGEIGRQEYFRRHEYKTFFNMGLVQARRCKHESALHLFHDVLRRIIVDSSSAPIGLACCHHIGRIHYFTGKYDESVTAFRGALHDAKFRLRACDGQFGSGRGYRHRNQAVLCTLRCIAKACTQACRFQEAVRYCQEAIDLVDEAADSVDPAEVAITFAVTALVHHRIDVTHAFALFQNFLNVATRFRLEDSHPHVVSSTLYTYAVSLMDLGRYDEALPLLLKVLRLRIDMVGLYHVDVSRTLVCIGNALVTQQNYADALSHYRRAVTIQTALLGRESPETIGTMFFVGSTLHMMCELTESLEVHRLVLSLVRRSMERDDPLVACIVKAMGNICIEMGEDEAALVYYQEADRINAANNMALPSATSTQDHSFLISLRLSVYSVNRPHAAAA